MASGPGERVIVRIEAELFDLARAYLANRTKEIEVIKAALQRRDFETIYRIGHNMHGSGRMFGFDELTAIGALLQGAVAAADSAGITRLQKRIGEFVSRVELRTSDVPASTVAAGAANSTARPDSERQYVLVVDDDEMNRVLVSHYLERAGYGVKQVSSGAEALAALARSPLPALILLDVVMAGMSGFEVCRRIKSGRRTKGIPVVLVTSLEMDEDRLRGMEAGADGFLSKPVERRDLLSRVCALACLDAKAGADSDS
jgi:CheY-like chemotaxis protein/HPt (histidine-containing phosphotransfer) domain-containing protein